MAQGNKSRIVIWTIVGILVVIAVVMLVTKPKTTAGPPINGQHFANQMEKRFEKLEGKVTAAQADFAGAPAEQWQKISDAISRGRRILGEMPGLTEQKDLRIKRDSTLASYSEARLALKAITGKEDKGDESGGQ